jgi:anaerobic glycerol-3-phosphate dehydrogenase
MILADRPFVRGIFWTWIETSFFRRRARSVPICTDMEADLPSLDQLRNNAAECIRLAEAARTSRQKSLFIEMAERWLTLAEHAAKTQAR